MHFLDEDLDNDEIPDDIDPIVTASYPAYDGSVKVNTLVFQHQHLGSCHKKSVTQDMNYLDFIHAVLVKMPIVKLK